MSFDDNPRDDEPMTKEEYELWEREQAMKRRSLSSGSTRLPIVPTEAPLDDGTAADTSRSEIEYLPPGRGWMIALLVVLLVLVFVGMVGAVLMFSRHAGGGRGPGSFKERGRGLGIPKEAVMGNHGVDWTLGDAKMLEAGVAQRILKRVGEYAEVDEMAARDRDWYFIAVNSGLRLSEVGHIEKADVLPNRLLCARRKKRHLQPAPIEVSPAVMEVLRRRAALVDAGPIFPGRAKPCIIHRSKVDKQTKVRSTWDEQVCVGGHASLRSIQRRWRLLLEELQVYMYGRGIHTLRHAAITNVYTMTKDLRLAQVFAGHESSKTTEVYAHVVDMQSTLAKLPVISGD